LHLLQVASFAKNPFSYNSLEADQKNPTDISPTTIGVGSSSVTLDLLDETGKKLAVTKTNQPVSEPSGHWGWRHSVDIENHQGSPNLTISNLSV